MQTVFSVRTPVSHLKVGDKVWHIGGGVSEVEKISHESDNTWVVLFEGWEPAHFVEDEIVLVRHEVE